MKPILASLIFLSAAPVALADPSPTVFRPISFICASGPDSVAYKVEENILGQQRSYKVTYIDSAATMFVVSTARGRHAAHRLALIDLRDEFRPSAMREAREIAFQMRLDADRFCNRSSKVRSAARNELLENHEFNRSHPRYR